MWNSGMMLRPMSPGASCKVSRMFFAEATRLATESGTIFGRDVVPDVCSTMPVSLGCE